MKTIIILDIVNGRDFVASTKDSNYYKVFDEITSTFIHIAVPNFFMLEILTKKNQNIFNCTFLTSTLQEFKIYHNLKQPSKSNLKFLKDEYCEYLI